MHDVILALGSNTANRQLQLERAISLCKAFASITKMSPAIETPAIGITAPPYANQMVRATTTLTLDKLTLNLKTIEQQLGRKRGGNIVAIDIDIMQYDNQRLHHDDWDRQYIKTLIAHL